MLLPTFCMRLWHRVLLASSITPLQCETAARACSAYIFFSSKASESVKNLIKSCPSLVSRLRALKEVHLEYENVQDRTFVTGQPTALAALLGQHATTERRKATLDIAAQRLCTAFVALGARPGKIVVRTPQELPDVGLGDTSQRKSLCRCA